MDLQICPMTLHQTHIYLYHTVQWIQSILRTTIDLKSLTCNGYVTLAHIYLLHILNKIYLTLSDLRFRSGLETCYIVLSSSSKDQQYLKTPPVNLSMLLASRMEQYTWPSLKPVFSKSIVTYCQFQIWEIGCSHLMIKWFCKCCIGMIFT